MLFTIYLLVFTLVAEKQSCNGGKKDILHGCLQSSEGDCAIACHNKSSMFVFGIGGACYGQKCTCWCHTDAFQNGTCNQIPSTLYNLYRYGYGKGESNFHKGMDNLILDFELTHRDP